MTIVGRLTRDSVVHTLEDGRKVAHFSLAVNDYIPVKSTGERVKKTAYFDCSFWRGDKVVHYLRKGTLVQVEGRVFARAFVGRDGTPKAALHCHVNTLKLLAGPKEVAVIGRPGGTHENADDVPF